jgi:putative ATP-dependent endonuclease of OLD family
MRLSDLTIRNFRCITEIHISIYDFTTLIGPNNAGKSTVLRAIQLLLENQKPELDEWPALAEPLRPIEIEATFTDIKDWERRKPGISGTIHNNQIQLKYMATRDPENPKKIVTTYLTLKPSELIEGWSETFKELSPEVSDIAKRHGITNQASWKTVASKERAKSAIREEAPHLIQTSDPDWTEEGTSIPAALQQALPQVIYVPAIIDPADAIKPAAKSVFGQLLVRVIVPTIQSSTEYTNLRSALSTLKSKIGDTSTQGFQDINRLMKQMSDRMKEIFPATVELAIEEPDFEKLISGIAGLRINDGTQTPIHLQGHGVQRSVIFAMIETMAQQLAASVMDATQTRATVLLFEEPELFMHPHLMRRLKASLVKLANREQFQVICTTHSPFLIEVAEDPRSLVIFKRESLQIPPVISQLSTDPLGEDERVQLRATLDFHPTVCEAFFAQRTVLVEGDTELAILRTLPELAIFYGISTEKLNSTTIVSCGGKWTIVPIAKLLKHFEINFRVIHDRDAKGRQENELAELRGFDPYCANHRIADATGCTNSTHVVQDTIEDTIVWDTERPKKDKPFQLWKRLRDDLAGGKTIVSASPALKTIFQFAYDW